MPGTDAMRIYLDSCGLTYRIEQRAVTAGCQQFITHDQRLARAAADHIDVLALDSAA